MLSDPIAIAIGGDACRVAVAKGGNTGGGGSNAADDAGDVVVVGGAQPAYVTFTDGGGHLVGSRAKARYDQNCKDAEEHVAGEETWKLKTAQTCDPTGSFHLDGGLPGHQRLFVRNT